MTFSSADILSPKIQPNAIKCWVFVLKTICSGLIWYVSFLRELCSKGFHLTFILPVVVVFQTGAETLEFFGRLKGLTGLELNKAVDYWLEQVDLSDARDRKTGKYSGGMRRRLCVAVAFIGASSVVLLDEPSASLDPASRQQLWRVIEKHKRDHCILLTVRRGLQRFIFTLHEHLLTILLFVALCTLDAFTG